jgi:hypothetical protein
MGRNEAPTEFVGNTWLNELVRFHQNPGGSKTWNDSRIKQSILVAFDIAYDKRRLIKDSRELVFPGLEDRFQVDRFAVTTDLDPVVDTIQERHFLERLSPGSLILEGDHARPRVAQC